MLDNVNDLLDDYIKDIDIAWKKTKADVRKLMQSRKVKQSLGLVASQLPAEVVKKANKKELRAIMDTIGEKVKTINGEYISKATTLGFTSEQLAQTSERVGWQAQIVDDVTKSAYERLTNFFDTKYGSIKELESELRTLLGTGKNLVVDEFKGIIKGYTDDLIGGKLTTAEWESALQKAIAEGYENAFRRAREDYGILDDLGKRDLGWLERQVKDEYEYLKNFRQDIEKDNLVDNFPDALRSRAELYGDADGGIYEAGVTSAMPEDILIWWKLGIPATFHCEDCPELADGSPYTIDTLPTFPGSGDTQCLTNCYCTLEYEDADGNLRGGIF